MSNRLGDLRGPDGHGGYVPPPEKPAKCFCWSCGLEIFNAAQGVSLTGAESWEVCVRCWEAVPIPQRLVIVQKMRQGNEVAETLNAVKSLLSLAIREYKFRSPAGEGASDN